MKSFTRGLAALLLSATLLSTAASAQDTASTERGQASAMVGMDVGASLKRMAAHMDMAAFERSFRNSFAGGEPLLDEATMRATTDALMAATQPAPPGAVPSATVDRTNAGLAAGIGVGMSLAAIRDELDVDVLMQAVRSVVAGEAPPLAEDEYLRVRDSFQQRMQAQAQARAAALGEKNAAEGAAFLAANKGKPGVITTGSGLQYMVLRDGTGPRPAMSDRVRVHYAGTLLDGQEFDSSIARNDPAEFRLDQVIPGWTEGLALMPTGSKYRFWIPGELAYGAKGTPGGPIGPNAVLVFEVELLEIL